MPMTISISKSKHPLLTHTNIPTWDLIPGFSDNGMCKNRSLIASLTSLHLASHFFLLKHNTENLSGSASTFVSAVVKCGVSE